MMTKIASAAAVLAFAGSALATNPWNLQLVAGATEGAPQGDAIGTTSSFYNNAFQTPAGGAPNGVFLGQFPDLAFDSYWGYGDGPTTEAGGAVSYAGVAGVGTDDGGDADGNAQVIAFPPAGVGYDATEIDVNGVNSFAAFIGRLSTAGFGSELTNFDNAGAPTIGIDVSNNPDPGNTVLFNLELNGPGQDGPQGNTYWFVSEVSEVALSDGTEITVHDLYIVTAIPTPGALALFGIAGAAAARRRRA